MNNILILLLIAGGALSVDIPALPQLVYTADVAECTYFFTSKFDIHYQGSTYQRVYVHPNGWLTFDEQLWLDAPDEVFHRLHSNKIGINTTGFTGISISQMVGLPTLDNLTIWLYGTVWYGSSGSYSLLEMVCMFTFFNQPYQLMEFKSSLDLNLVFCGKINCYWSGGAPIVKDYQYGVCPLGQCFSSSFDCQTQPGNFLNCSNSTCRPGYVYNKTTNACSDCNSTGYAMFNGACVEKVANCANYSSDPGVCLVCNKMSGPYCNQQPSEQYYSAGYCKRTHQYRMILAPALAVSLALLIVLVVVLMQFPIQVFSAVTGAFKAIRNCCLKCIKRCRGEEQRIRRQWRLDFDSFKLREGVQLNSNRPCCICDGPTANLRLGCESYCHSQCLEMWQCHSPYCPGCRRLQQSVFFCCSSCKGFDVQLKEKADAVTEQEWHCQKCSNASFRRAIDSSMVRMLEERE